MNMKPVELNYLFQSTCEETDDSTIVVYQWWNAEKLRLVEK